MRCSVARISPTTQRPLHRISYSTNSSSSAAPPRAAGTQRRLKVGREAQAAKSAKSIPLPSRSSGYTNYGDHGYWEKRYSKIQVLLLLLIYRSLADPNVNKKETESYDWYQQWRCVVKELRGDNMARAVIERMKIFFFF